eukprot:2331470-Prymnesium_polylepis.1
MPGRSGRAPDVGRRQAAAAGDKRGHWRCGAASRSEEGVSTAAAPLGVDETSNKPAHTRQSQNPAELKLGAQSVHAERPCHAPALVVPDESEDERDISAYRRWPGALGSARRRALTAMPPA